MPEKTEESNKKKKEKILLTKEDIDAIRYAKILKGGRKKVMDHYKISGSKVSAIWNTDDFYRHVSYYTDKRTPNLPEWYIASPPNGAIPLSKGGAIDPKTSADNNQPNTSQLSQNKETEHSNEKQKRKRAEMEEIARGMVMAEMNKISKNDSK